MRKERPALGPRPAVWGVNRTRSLTSTGREGYFFDPACFEKPVFVCMDAAPTSLSGSKVNFPMKFKFMMKLLTCH